MTIGSAASPAGAGSPCQTWRGEAPFRLESGEEIASLEVAYRTWGRLNARRDNGLVVCHALTGSPHVDDWWAPLLGPGRALDTDRYFIVCSNVLGGCYGTSGPASPGPDGRPWGPRFPRVTLRDQVRAQIALADRLGLTGIASVVGGSMGGLQALEWALLEPRRVRSVVSLAASARHSPWCLAWSEAQRLALTADPCFRNGHYPPDDPPVAGLAAARAVAMISYRSPDSLEARFGRSTVADGFAVNEWLRHHGEALVRRFDANAYLTLLDAMDSHDLARGRADSLAAGLAGLQQPVLVVSLSSDLLYTPAEQAQLARLLPRGVLWELATPHGHDAFLIEAERLEGGLRRFLGEHGRPITRTERASGQREGGERRERWPRADAGDEPVWLVAPGL